MQEAIRLVGRYTKMDELHQFELEGPALRRLADLLSESTEGKTPIRLRIGSGSLELQKCEANSFQACLLPDGTVSITAGVSYLTTLGDRLAQVSRADSEVDHIHLDAWW